MCNIQLPAAHPATVPEQGTATAAHQVEGNNTNNNYNNTHNNPFTPTFCSLKRSYKVVIYSFSTQVPDSKDNHEEERK